MILKPTLGVCYYPEHWPQELWAKDAAEMAASGFTWVRIGEFSWSRIEPRPGELHWEWLDEAITVLGGAGLGVVLSTPTATPPRWMLEKWPDMLAVDLAGNPRKFGSRRHYCFSHLGYQQESQRIAKLFAQRYGDNPHVQAWQIDNEYGCHDTVISYSGNAQSAFRLWLAQHYGSIDKLNAAWGNVFWSMEYRSFDEIDLPNLTVTEPNPSHVLDFRRFSSDQVVHYNTLQAQILRQYSAAPLIHNYMGRIVEFDHFAVGEDLDIASWDSYPLGFLEDRSDASSEHQRKYAQQGDPDFQALHHDLYRAVGKGRWWVMEQQPGPVNWAPNNPAPLEGMVRLWTWEAFAHGAEALLYFRWRQLPFAQEQMHSGLKTPANLVTQGLREATEVGAELAQGMDLEPLAAPVAIVFDYESAWAWHTQPQGENFDYFRLVFDYYRALRSLGLSVDFVSKSTTDFSGYKLVLVPALMHLSKVLQQALTNSNAYLVFGPRTGSKDAHLAIQTEESLLPDEGVAIAYVESFRGDMPRPLELGGAVNFWQETLETNAEVLEVDQRGKPIRVGSLQQQYIAGWLDQVGMKRVLEQVCQHASIEINHLPEGLRIRDTKHYRFIFNYSTQHQHFNGVSIGPAEVHWMKHQNMEAHHACNIEK
jgi:beta-galactosidase